MSVMSSATSSSVESSETSGIQGSDFHGEVREVICNYGLQQAICNAKAILEADGNGIMDAIVRYRWHHIPFERVLFCKSHHFVTWSVKHSSPG